jgi:hypothetical protein
MAVRPCGHRVQKDKTGLADMTDRFGMIRRIVEAVDLDKYSSNQGQAFGLAAMTISLPTTSRFRITAS